MDLPLEKVSKISSASLPPGLRYAQLKFQSYSIQPILLPSLEDNSIDKSCDQNTTHAGSKVVYRSFIELVF